MTQLWRRRYVALALLLVLLERRKAHGFQNPVLHVGRTGSSASGQQVSSLAPIDDDSLSADQRTGQLRLLEPDSSESRRLIQDEFGLSTEQYEQLCKLTVLVCDWNARVNLVSRKDCSPSVVWTRHVLPSVSAAAHRSLPIHSARSVVDVGTGGGFPGLPLAIAFPAVEFLLLDSVGKKLGAVQEMARELGLSNVSTHHSRAEELVPDRRFEVATGRSVASLPQFCSYMHHLVGGSLMYWIGSNRASTGVAGDGEAAAGGGDDDIPRAILDACNSDVAIEPLLLHLVPTDKRILTFDRAAVRTLASLPHPAKTPSDPRSRTSKQWKSPELRPKRSERPMPMPEKAKQARTSRRWQRGDEGRGTDTFRRYDSSAGTRPKE